MKKIETILRNTNFVSSSTKTPQFKAFATEFKKEFKKELSTIGATDIEFSIGHFFITGFFNVKDKLYYFSLNDVRFGNSKDKISLLYRTAEHRKDFRGGSNQWIDIEENMAQNMRL